METISDFVSGDDVAITKTFTIPSGTILSQAWFTVKKKFEDADNAAIISKLITAVNQSGIGWIENVSTGKIHFYLTPIDTAKLVGYSEYPYSIKLQYSNGEIHTPETGHIISTPAVKQGVT